MESLDTIKSLIENGEVDCAIRSLNEYIERSKTSEEKSQGYYLIGNAYRKAANWQQALNNYHLAIELNPNSPAVQARKVVIDILDFYHKDMFNQ